MSDEKRGSGKEEMTGDGMQRRCRRCRRCNSSRFLSQCAHHRSSKRYAPRREAELSTIEPILHKPSNVVKLTRRGSSWFLACLRWSLRGEWEVYLQNGGLKASTSRAGLGSRAEGSSASRWLHHSQPALCTLHSNHLTSPHLNLLLRALGYRCKPLRLDPQLHLASLSANQAALEHFRTGSGSLEGCT